MNSPVPNGWSRELLEDVVSEIGDGGTPCTSKAEYFGGNIPWVVIDDITRKIEKTRQTITDLGLAKSSAKIWKTGTLILSTGATIGEVGIAQVPLATKQGINGIVCKDNLAVDFLYQFFLNSRQLLNTLSQGSTIKEVRAPILKKISILIPPFQEQQKIAAILTAVDEVIESTQAQISKLKDLKTAMMQELLTKGIGHTEFKDSAVGRIPKTWEVLPLEKKATLIPGYAFSSDDFVTTGIPLIRMGNLYQNQLDLARASIFMPMEFIDKYKKFVIRPGDIVFSMTGTAGKEDYGYAVKIPTNTPICLLNQRVAKIVASAGVNIMYLHNLLNSRVFLNEIYLVGKGTKQANLSSANILSVELPFPPINEQKIIAETLDAISNRIAAVNFKRSQLHSIKKALMQDLLTGKVRVRVN